jgi:hypothetical protein
MSPATLWLLGLAVGTTGVPMASYSPIIGVALLGLLAAALVRSRSVALFGGLSFAVGVWFSFLEWRSVEQCASFDRNGGFCEILDPGPGASIPLLFLVVGVALSAYGLLRRAS